MKRLIVNADDLGYDEGVNRALARIGGVPPWLADLALTRDGWLSELMIHPGYDGDWREEDLRALLDPRVRERLGRTMSSWSVLLDGGLTFQARSGKIS